MTLLRIIGDRIQALVGDKGYNSDAIREELHKAGIEPVIPARRNRRQPADFSREIYKERNRIEGIFNRLKNWRRVATRYAKSAASFLAFVSIAVIKQWLPPVSHCSAKRRHATLLPAPSRR